MSLTAASLRDLHRFHRQQTDLKERLAAGPRHIKAAESTIQTLEETRDQCKETYTRARVQSDDQQLQLQEREQRIINTREKLNNCSTNREFQALKDQIEADVQVNNVLADEILELLENLEEHETTVTEAQQNLDKAAQELDKIRLSVQADQEGLQNDLERIQMELKAAETTLPGDLRTEYSRIIAARGEEALAPVDGTVCGGCFQTLTPQTLDQLLMAKTVFCKSCGCLLYSDEDPVSDDN